MQAAGKLDTIDESKIDAATGVMGYGPAYAYQFIEALEQHKDPQEALLVLSEITTFSLADQVFDHCWVDGIFVNTSLDTLAAGCPLWVPAMDQIIANDEGLDVIALVNRS